MSPMTNQNAAVSQTGAVVAPAKPTSQPTALPNIGPPSAMGATTNHPQTSVTPTQPGAGMGMSMSGTGDQVNTGQLKSQSLASELGKLSATRDMPDFLDQDRPKKVKKTYRALKREHPDMPAGTKARIASSQGKSSELRKVAGPPARLAARSVTQPSPLQSASNWLTEYRSLVGEPGRGKGPKAVEQFMTRTTPEVSSFIPKLTRTDREHFVNTQRALQGVGGQKYPIYGESLVGPRKTSNMDPKLMHQQVEAGKPTAALQQVTPTQRTPTVRPGPTPHAGGGMPGGTPSVAPIGGEGVSKYSAVLMPEAVSQHRKELPGADQGGTGEGLDSSTSPTNSQDTMSTKGVKAPGIPKGSVKADLDDSGKSLKAAFARGFARELALMGMSPTELEDGLRKTAADGAAGIPNFLAKALDTVGTIGLRGAALAAGVPAAIGGALGYTLQGTRDVSKADLAALQQISLLKDYDAAIKEMERTRDRKDREQLSLITG